MKGKFHLKGNLNKILPTIFSILLFASVFVFIMLKGKNNPENKLQLAPKNNLYKEKFSVNKSYESKDVSESGIIKNIRINSRGGASEPKIAGHPDDHNILAVSSNDFSIEENHARIFISKDFGLNWEPKEVRLSSKFKHSAYSDPWIDFDADGNLYFTAVQIDIENNYQEGIFISRSNDNGNTWESENNFIDFNNKKNIQIDRPEICIDKFSSHKNNIYVTWIEIKGLTSFIMFSKSNDGGKSFSHPLVIEKDNVDYCNVINNADGDLFEVYVKDDNKIMLEKSTNEGNTWVKINSYINFVSSGTKSEGQFLIKNYESKGIRINSEPSLTFSKEGDLLMTYTAAGNENNVSDIYFAKMNIKSFEIGKPVIVNSDNTMSDQFLPTIVSDEGNIFIIYQDSRNDRNNLLTETFVSFSKDGGVTFTDEKLSTRNFNPLTIAIERYFCDYNSSLICNGKLVSVWTDGRNNDFDIYAGIFNVNDFLENKSH